MASAVAAQERKPVFISDARLHEIRQRIDAKTEPTYAAYVKAKQQIDDTLDVAPVPPAKWFVPGYYNDPEGHHNAKAGLRDDANRAYGAALMYRLTGEAKYARAAVRRIDAWTGVKDFDTVADSKLSFSYHYPAMILAADLIRGDEAVWPAENQRAFEAFLRDKALPMNCMDRQNNWGNWGCVLVMAVASYLNDDALIATAGERWKSFIEDQINDRGELHHETGRNDGTGGHGIWYSHFSLMPQAIAAEIARQRGVDLYDYVSPSGRSMKQAFDTLVPWTADRKTFPHFKPKDEKKRLVGTDYASYFELLNTRWPNDTAAAFLKRKRPLTADHVAPFLTLTHGDLPAGL